MTPPAWCLLCPLSPGAAGVTCQVTGVIFHQGTGPVPALNVTSGVATGGGKGHHGFYYLKPSSLQQQPEKYPGALIFIEVIISAGFSPRLFFFFPLIFLSFSSCLPGRFWLVGFYFGGVFCLFAFFTWLGIFWFWGFSAVVGFGLGSFLSWIGLVSGGRG